MAAVVWTELRGPGVVTWARPGPDGTVIAVGTDGGHLYLRLHTAAGWVWERAGFPPADASGDSTVLSAVPLSGGGPGAATLAVLGDDLQVWLYQSQAAPQPWTSLGGPVNDPGAPRLGGPPSIVASTAGHRGTPQHTLLMRDWAARLWMRQGVDPDTTWFPIALDANLLVWNLAAAMASVTPGADPQLHIFAVGEDTSRQESALRVAVRENSVWTWNDPAAPDGLGGFVAEVSATSVRDGGGRLQAAALVQVSADDTTLSLFMGSGPDWRRTELGRPATPDFVTVSVIAVKGADPQVGADPVGVARVGDHIWTRSASAGWSDRGTPPGDGVVVDPAAALDQAGAVPGQWTVGVSWAADLWTLGLDASGARWEAHGYPGSLVSVVGAYDDTPEVGVSGVPVAVYGIDEHGALWACRAWSDGADPPFRIASGTWTHHGAPAAGVTCAAAIGALGPTGNLPRPAGSPPEPAWVFVVGSDGHLWARTATPDGWTWADHGTPGGRAIRNGVGPIAAGPAGGVAVHVLADDGRVWMRSGMSAGPGPGADWGWTDRGVPPGQLVFAIAGAVTLSPSSPIAIVITLNGHPWAVAPAGTGSGWTDLGVPAPSEKIVVGIGAQTAGGALEVAALGAPSGQIWTARWTPGQAAAEWTARGRPADQRIRDIIGMVPGPAGNLIGVIGHDQQIWVMSTASPAPSWTRWDPPTATTTVTSGRAMVLLRQLPCAIVLDQTKRVQIVSSPS